jgi:hypothetical protein
VTVSGGTPVFIKSDGQLGTLTSSRRFKEEIEDIGQDSRVLFELRPVRFRYKLEIVGEDRPLEFGLIAEEVAEVYPELVVYDKEGRPEAVKYHFLSSLLLNELQKQAIEIQWMKSRLERLEGRELGSRRGGLRGPP